MTRRHSFVYSLDTSDIVRNWKDFFFFGKVFFNEINTLEHELLLHLSYFIKKVKKYQKWMCNQTYNFLRCLQSMKSDKIQQKLVTL